MEGVVLLLVSLSPWAFGAVDTTFELLLDVGVALLLALWGVGMALEGRLSWRASPVAVLLAALFFTGIAQLVPLPRLPLATLSPGAARLYDTLLPSEPEALPEGAEREAPAYPPGRTLSLYPTATRAELVRLLAVLALFVVVRTTLASPAALRRLAFVALVNGALLSLFALLQFFTSPKGWVYWTYETPGDVFGPFLNRNHFAWYINLCVGLGLGLLFRRPCESGRDGARSVRQEAPARASASEGRAPGSPTGRRRRRRSRPTGPRFYQPEEARGKPSPAPGPFLTPEKLWLLFPVVLMLAGLFFSLSRGAIVAGLVAALVCLLVRLFAARRSARRAPLVLLPVVVAGALLIWFGCDRVRARLATLWEGDALQASRLPVWSSALPLVQDFPVCGTGLGTFGSVESLHRTNPAEAGIAYEHAHNEYLELLVETGAVGLVLGVVALGLVFRYAYRAAARHESRPTRALALGALFALTATAVHAFVEFGLHIPAIAVLVAVLAAHLCALGSDDGEGVPGPADGRGGKSLSGAPARRFGRLAPLAGALTAVTIGLVLCTAGFRAYLTQHLLTAALGAKTDAADPGWRQQQIAYLETAAGIAPEDAQVEFELAQAHFEALEDVKQLTAAAGQVSDASQALLLAAAVPDGGAGAAAARAAVPFGALGPLLTSAVQRREEEATREHLVPALRHCLLARDLCPTLAQPHVRLADHADRLQHGDGRGAYLRRAKRLVSFDPELWYFAGLQELLDDHPDEAWDSWRHSLQLSGDRLPDIVHRAASALTPAELMDRVLPDAPDLLYDAAMELYPDPPATGLEGPLDLDRRPEFWAGRLVLSGAGNLPDLPAALWPGSPPLAERRPFLEKALALLEGRPEKLPARDLYLKARVHWALWQLGSAHVAYQEALAMDGLNAQRRFEFAQLLYQEGRLREARRELLLVLALPTCPGQAGHLLDVVTHERARKEDILK